MANRTLNARTLEYGPYVMKDADGRWVGVLVDLLDIITQSLHISYRLSEQEDGLWGSPDGQGGYSGIIGAVHRGEADLGLLMFTQTAGRSRGVDFLEYIRIDTDVLVMARPKSNSFSYFTRPFHGAVWGTLLACLVAMTCALTSCSILHADKDMYPTYPLKDAPHIQRAVDAFWFLIHSVFAQGTSLRRKPHLVSTQILVGHWWIFLVLLTALYTSVMTSLMTVRKITLPINNLEDLAKSSNPLSFMAHSATHEELLTSNDVRVQRILQRSVKMGAVVTADYDDIIGVVANRSDVVGHYQMDAYRTLSWRRPDLAQQKCHLSVTDATLGHLLSSIAIQKNHPNKDDMSKIILQLRETGVISKLLRKYETRSQCDGSERRNPQEPIRLHETFGLFCLLAAGLCSAVLVVVGELLIRAKCVCELGTPSNAVSF